MRHALVFNIISLLTFLAAVFFLVTRGLNFSIEFTGGTAVEATYAQTADLERLRGVVRQLGYGDVQVQNYGTSHDVIIRVPTKDRHRPEAGAGPRVRGAVQGRAGTVGTKTETTPRARW
jgi:preprotein translocase subunit SecF